MKPDNTQASETAARKCIPRAQWRTPTLETKRLILRPLNKGDAYEAFKRWTSDEDVARYMSWNTHISPDETLEWLKYEEASLGSWENFTFGIALKDTHELIGSGGILYDDKLDRYGIGYCLMKSSWGKGYATEASRCFLDFAIATLGITSFFAYHACDNPSSGKVLKKLGFSFAKYGTFISADGAKKFSRKEYYLDV